LTSSSRAIPATSAGESTGSSSRLGDRDDAAAGDRALRRLEGLDVEIAVDERLAPGQEVVLELAGGGADVWLAQRRSGVLELLGVEVWNPTPAT
jgi:hypothetical protein